VSAAAQVVCRHHNVTKAKFWWDCNDCHRRSVNFGQTWK